MLEIIKTFLILALGALVAYYKLNTRLTQKITAFINQAEEVYREQTEAGKIKFNFVLKELERMIPAFLKPFIKEEMLESLIQSIFDEMQNFAEKQMNQVIDQLKKEDATSK